MPQTLQTATQQDLEAILQATPSLILVFETGGKILAANHAAARLFGRSSDQMAGKNIFKIFKFADTPLKTHVLEIARSHGVYSFEDIYQSRKLSCILYPILDTNGNAMRVTLLAQDNTEQRHAEEQVRSLTQELE